MPTPITSEFNRNGDEQKVRARRFTGKEPNEESLFRPTMAVREKVGFIESQASRAHGKLLVAMRCPFCHRTSRNIHSIAVQHHLGSKAGGGARGREEEEREASLTSGPRS